MFGFAQEQPQVSDNLSVQQAIDIARSNNPAINQFQQQISLRRATRWGAIGLDTPRLSYFKEGIPKGSGGDFLERRWTVTQAIDFPLTSLFRMNRLGGEIGSLELKMQAEELRLIALVKKAYARIAYALEIYSLRMQQLSIAEDLHNAVTTRIGVGEASELELMNADIQLAEAKNELSNADLLFERSRYELFNTIGLNPEQQSYGIDFPDTLQYSYISIEQEDVLELLEQQPEYVAAYRNSQAANWGVKEAWSAMLPRIDFSYFVMDLGTGYDFYGFEFGLSVPLWLPFNERSRIQSANSIENRFIWREKEIYLDLKRRIESAWHGYDASQRNIDRYHEIIRRKAQTLLILTLEGYRAGELDILAALQAQQTFLVTEQRYFEALLDYYIELIELEQFLQKDLVFLPSS
jgi:cobalt-zinc-cadmium efflux system outer membrane protein